ncbi:hypothetical protein [Pseudooctadecabacter sp.]|uniref:hypothetical protein n=1 Tax=Pseudooctadecabacter sp. TaxID=1966338 RepID=UPI0035C7DA2A
MRKSGGQIRQIAVVALMVLPATTMAQTAEVSVMIRDGDPHDRIYIRNTGRCPLGYGVLGLDFTTSAGHILIDTAYGGAGTKDPMPVEVESGPLSVHPVLDGDRQIVMDIEGLAQGQSGVVTLDVDNEASGWFASRVSILNDHLEGTEARFASMSQDARGVFDATGTVIIGLPQDMCAPLEDAPSTVPMD